MLKVSVKRMKILDQYAQDKYDIPALILMENAGLRASDIVFNLLKNKKDKRILVFCGPGNNGGDGFVLARHLFNKGIKVKVFVLSKKVAIKGDALINLNILLRMGLEIKEILDIKSLREVKSALRECGLVVDAIFGIGLNKNPQGIFAEVISFINESRKTIVSLDIPSGLCADTGKIFGVGVRAYATVTFGAAKKGMFSNEGRLHTGKLVVADISLPRQLVNEHKNSK